MIDAEGMTLLPGLIDCHVHVMRAWHDMLRRRDDAALARPALCRAQSRATLEAGITTVRDAGGTPAGVKMAVERGLFPGPRMLVAVTILSQTGGHGDDYMPCCVDLRDTTFPMCRYSVVDGVEAMRQKVREMLRAGADWIKLCTSGGVLSPADSPNRRSSPWRRSPPPSMRRARSASAAWRTRRARGHQERAQGGRRLHRAWHLAGRRGHRHDVSAASIWCRRWSRRRM